MSGIALNQVIVDSHIEGGAQGGAKMPECSVGVRVLRSGESIFLDLADEDWRAVEITKSSSWRLVPNPPAMFCRAHGMTALPVPVTGWNITGLRSFLNVTDDQWILIVAWLLAAFHPAGPYPILILQGEQGSGKSSAARVLRRLVDPSTALLRSVPRDERDLIIGASRSWITAIDNLSGIPQWLSDALCRLSTGGAFGTRQLYTDEEEMLFDAKRPILLNGIDDIARFPDLADRSLIVTLPQLTEDKRETEDAFEAAFQMAYPRIFGAILDAAAMAHRNLDTVQIPNRSRMADFEQWVCAACPALPFTGQQFLEAYQANRRDSVSLTLESSPVATAIIQSLVLPWEGTHTELLGRLNSIVSQGTQKLRSWPKDARALSSALRRLAPPLRVQGIEITAIERDPNTNAKRLRLEKTAP